MCASRSPTPRKRLGVAILFDAETTAEIDGLRRGLGEPDRGRIPPHLTLVPPVNVREVNDARVLVRAAAHAVKPFDLELGPVATFLTDNPVAYLSVNGDLDTLLRLRGGVFKPPLKRDLTWPYIPHVTVADGIAPDVIAAAPAVLASFRKTVAVRSVSLLEEQGKQWVPIGTYPLGKPAVIGRGGQPLEIDTLDAGDSVVITAYREGRSIGSATGWRHGTTAWLGSLTVDEMARRDGIGTHLLAAFDSWAAAGGADRTEIDPAIELGAGGAEFLGARGRSLAGQ